MREISFLGTVFQVIFHYLTWLWKFLPPHCYEYFDISQRDISTYQTVFLNLIWAWLICSVYCSSVDYHSFCPVLLRSLISGLNDHPGSSVSSINEILLLATVSHCKVLYKRTTYDLWEQFVHLQELFTTKPSLDWQGLWGGWLYCKSNLLFKMPILHMVIKGECLWVSNV